MNGDAPEFSSEDLALTDHLFREDETAGDAPAPVVSPDPDIERELKELATLRRDNPQKYWSEATQKRERELYAMREEGQAADPRSTFRAEQSVQDELDQLAALRRTHPDKYWNVATQQRERELIEERDQLQQTSRESEAVSNQIEQILETMPEGEAEAFESGFAEIWDDLPENAQAVIQHELSSRADPVRPASRADVERFGSTQEGAELLKVWGDRAATKVAALQERMERLTQAGEDVGEWFDSLPGPQAKAILKALAG